MNTNVIVDDFRWYGNETYPAVGSPDGQFWRTKDTSSSGSPTLIGAGGFFTLGLDSTNEVQNICLYGGDILPYAIADLIRVDIWCKLTSSFASACTMSIGLASARHDTPESIAALALFKCVGNNSLVVSTDDGVNDLTDKATGLSLSTTVKRLSMDFATGVQTRLGVTSLGGKGNVLFSADDDRGLLRPVCRDTIFDMSNYSSGLQLFAQVQKSAATSTGTLSIQRIRVERKQN